MPSDVAGIKEALKSFNFKHLFIEELLWDRYQTRSFTIDVDGKLFDLSPIAEKRGMVVLECQSDDGKIPKYAIRDKIDRNVTKTHREHIIIFTDSAKTEQLWQWVDRAIGRPRKVCDHLYQTWKSGDSLVHKLRSISIELNENDSITLGGIVARTRDALYKDRVTKQFFEKFQKQHEAFLAFVTGITSATDQQWYASLMLNRLMFVYFIQKQGFLDDNVDYLRDRLNKLRSTKGPDQFHSFYRHFLLRLFHEGLGKQAKSRPSELDKLLGRVPYLNGGLFDEHQLETQYQIDIPDEAFDQIFQFFDGYDWYLDDRPLKDDREINPDVLGYIFEKYINVVSTPTASTKQKEMGAYYTKEDVTEYIAKSTIIPYVFSRVSATHDSEQFRVFSLLTDDPDEYIYAKLCTGIDIPLPAEIAEGIADTSKRTSWNQLAAPEFANNLETWREVIARRAMYKEIKDKVSKSTIESFDDLVTLNIDIWQLAEDAIRSCDQPTVLSTYYQVISSLSILDPTCGSGAFLFAALNILKGLYDACLSRMEFMVAEAPDSSLTELEQFKAVLAEVGKHANREFFILKSITLGNLYGVDLMEEAVEICKLRLFLKLISQVNSFEQIEALPDIDFNIRPGNTLIGFSTGEAVRESISKSEKIKSVKQLKLPLKRADAFRRIEDSGLSADKAFEHFRSVQTKTGIERSIYVTAKRQLLDQLQGLDRELNRYLATDFGIGSNDSEAFSSWCKSHQPLHWHVDFYGIMNKNGGFDIIIGNPPYVVYKPAESPYQIRGFQTMDTGDLYAYVMERSYELCREGGRIGLIVPISSFGVDGFEPLQQLSLSSLQRLWISCYSNRPSQIFDGAQKRLTIILGLKREESSEPCEIKTSSYYRWKKEEREELFPARLHYQPRTSAFMVFKASLEKIGNELEASIFEKLMATGKTLSKSLARSTNHKVYYTRKFGYFLLFLDRVPINTEIKTGKVVPPSELKDLSFKSKAAKFRAISVLSSSTFFWFWNIVSDCRNLNKRDLLAFPISIEDVSKELKTQLEVLGQNYVSQLSATSKQMQKSGKYLETFDYALCKPILNEIDQAIGTYLGLTDDEIDYIINYDIKYRIGSDDDG